MLRKSDPMRDLGLNLLLLQCIVQFVDSEWILIFCDFSLEGVNVVLQMLDLLCKLKNDVKGLKVEAFAAGWLKKKHVSPTGY